MSIKTKQYRMILKAFFLMIALSFNSLAQSKTDRAVTLVNEGNALLEKDDYRGALAKFAQAIQLDAEYPWSYWSAGRAFAKLHEHKLAAESFVIFLEKGENIPVLFIAFQIGDQYRLAKDFKLSKEIFDLALTGTPKYLLDYEALADIYNYRGDLENAVKYRLLAINYSNSDSEDDVSRYIGLSWHYSFLRQHQNAVNAATKAIGINNRAAMAYTNRCRAYNDLKFYDDAIADCRRALELSPDHGETQYYMANSYRAKGNVKEAARLNTIAIPNLLNELNAAIKAELITIHDYCYILGNALFQEGRYTEAVDIYSRGLEFLPNFPLLRFNLGMAHLQNDNNKGAWEQFYELEKINFQIANSLKEQILNKEKQMQKKTPVRSKRKKG